MILFRHEMRMNVRNLLIWTVCVAGLCFSCILLYTSLEDSVQNMANSFADMGNMSVALGMDKMSLATLEGYYATEIALMHGLGGAMFAAILGAGLLSKEESGHTSEFLHTLPIKRKDIVVQKYLSLLCSVLIFNLVSLLLYLAAFGMMGEQIGIGEIMLYHLSTILMQIEIGSICFMISAFTKRTILGVGLGITILAFALDMMCRILPAIENVKYVTPFYYANAADIFSMGKIDEVKIGIGVGITLISCMITGKKYCGKDLSS